MNKSMIFICSHGWLFTGLVTNSVMVRSCKNYRLLKGNGKSDKQYQNYLFWPKEGKNYSLCTKWLSTEYGSHARFPTAR